MLLVSSGDSSASQEIHLGAGEGSMQPGLVLVVKVVVLIDWEQLDDTTMIWAYEVSVGFAASAWAAHFPAAPARNSRTVLPQPSWASS